MSCSFCLIQFPIQLSERRLLHSLGHVGIRVFLTRTGYKADFAQFAFLFRVKYCFEHIHFIRFGILAYGLLFSYDSAESSGR